MHRFRPAFILSILAVASGLFASSAGSRDAETPAGILTFTPGSISFNGAVNGAAPSAQTLGISAARSTRFTAAVASQSGGRNWLSISPSGTLTTDRNVAVSVNPSGLAAGTYSGAISVRTSTTAYNVPVTLTLANPASVAFTPRSLAFTATQAGANPASQNISVTAPVATRFTAAVTTQNGGGWLSINPSGALTTNRTIAVSVRTSGLAAGTYTGAITATVNNSVFSAPVTLTINAATGGGGGGGGTGTSGYKLIGWNDLGMHCQDGKDFSVFSVLPPFNTIHAHLVDNTGALVVSDIGYTITYEAVTDPLTNTRNTTSIGKTNFWQYAAALGYGSLAPDAGLKGYKMPGAANTPQPMTFSTADNTWTAIGIPIMPYADAPSAPYPVNYFPMMRLTARNTLGTVLATTDIVLPVSDEMTCSVCHASNTGTFAAKPTKGWANNSDPAKDIKYNILRKHDERFASTQLFQSAATQVGYNAAGLEVTTATKPVLCATCHASNALGLNGVSGVQPLTTAMHALHSSAVDPATNQTLDSAIARDACYRCHPGPNTKCLRGAMGSLKTSTGANAVECQSCHGTMSSVAVATRNGWLDEPSCQSCHTGTATNNNGQIAYTSVFSSANIVRTAVDQTFATNANTPSAGLSLYRFSKGHGGLQCEACHGSTHAEYTTAVVNDNVQSTNLQGHTGMLVECTACHSSMPSTVTGGPHGLHPVGSSWVNSHPDIADSQGTAQCQTCHGTDYRGTILSKVQADRTLAGRSFPKGTIIGCYSCHNGPNGGD